jgi:L-amino acid N-acyltransferase YncA
LILRLLKKRDYDEFKKLFDDSYSEYLQLLKRENPTQYEKERQEKNEVTFSGFCFYLKSGSSFAAEENGEIVGYVASQTVPSMHGNDLWIEYIVVQQSSRRQGIGTALLRKLIEHARSTGIDRIYAFINPDNEASMKMHSKAGFDVNDWKIASYKTLS